MIVLLFNDAFRCGNFTPFAASTLFLPNVGLMWATVTTLSKHWVDARGYMVAITSPTKLLLVICLACIVIMFTF